MTELDALDQFRLERLAVVAAEDDTKGRRIGAGTGALGADCVAERAFPLRHQLPIVDRSHIGSRLRRRAAGNSPCNQNGANGKSSGVHLSLAGEATPDCCFDVANAALDEIAADT